MRVLSCLFLFSGWKRQPAWVQQTVLHHQNPREHHRRWVSSATRTWFSHRLQLRPQRVGTDNGTFSKSVYFPQVIFSRGYVLFLFCPLTCAVLFVFLWIMMYNARSECGILTIYGEITGCCILMHAKALFILDNRLASRCLREMGYLTAPPSFLAGLQQIWPRFIIQLLVRAALSRTAWPEVQENASESIWPWAGGLRHVLRDSAQG